MKRILVCDDDSGISEVIKIILEQAHYHVTTICNGRAIQKKIKEYQPDVILLDIWMPGISGKEIITLLKRDKQLSHIPIIVISALSDTEKIAQKYGADDFLPKPFEAENLLALVKKYSSEAYKLKSGNL